MLKNLDESRDSRCPGHDKDLNGGHDSTVRRAQLTEKCLRQILEDCSRIIDGHLPCGLLVFGQGTLQQLLCDRMKYLVGQFWPPDTCL